MKRRRLLTLAGTTALAGCSSLSLGDGGDATVTPVDRQWPEIDSRFAGGVPPLSDNGTAWYHETTEATRTYLEPSTERITAPGQVTFRLVNHRRTEISGNPHAWALYKLVDSSWYRIAPWEIPLPLHILGPGETYEYTLHAFHGDPTEASDPDAHKSITVGHLGGGRYAFEADFAAEGDPSPAAQFTLDAPPLTVEPAPEATVETATDRTVVTLPEWNDGEHPPNATLTVRRSRDADADRRLIPEQLVRDRHRPLRNALAVFDDGPVDVRTDRRGLPDLSPAESGPQTLRYRGVTYSIETQIEQ